MKISIIFVSFGDNKEIISFYCYISDSNRSMNFFNLFINYIYMLNLISFFYNMIIMIWFFNNCFCYLK